MELSNYNTSRRSFLKWSAAALSTGLYTQLIGSPISLSTSQENPSIFIDAYTCIGPRKYKHEAERWTLADLQSELTHCSIAGALVSYTQSVYYDAHSSNLELSSMLERHPGLHAIWNLLPSNTAEFPAIDELDSLLEKYQVRAVTICPNTNSWDWKLSIHADLLKYLNRKKILTIFPLAEIGTWDDLELFLKRYPKIPVLLINIFWNEQRNLIPMMEKYPNLHCTFENLQHFYGIENMVEKGLIKQMIFASNAPTMAAGAHRAFIDYADVTDEQRRAIASGNLTRLVKGLTPSNLALPPHEDQFMRAARLGLPMPVPIIDLHMHMLEDGMNGAGWGYTMTHGGPTGIFKLAQRLGYGGGGIMSWNGVVSVNTIKGNLTTQKALDVAPKGFWGLANFDPQHYSQEDLKQIIPAFYEQDKRFIGMKPYHYIGKRYDHPDWDVWWEYGNEHHFYGLLHSQQSDMNEYERLAEKYPNVRWLIAHSGQSFPFADKAIQVAQKYPNVYLEITLTSVPGGMIDYLATHAGADKVVYGSDLPMRDPRPQLGWVVYSRLSPQDKQKILRDNALNIIKPNLNRLPAHAIPTIIK